MSHQYGIPGLMLSWRHAHGHVHALGLAHRRAGVLARADAKFSNLVARLLRGSDTAVLYLDLPSQDLSIRRLYRKCEWTGTKFKLSKKIQKVPKN